MPIFNQAVKIGHHFFVIAIFAAVHREHTRRFSDADDLFTRQTPMDISFKGCEKRYIFYMAFAV